METQIGDRHQTDRDNKNASTLKKLAGLLKIQRNLHKRTKLKKKQML